MAVSRATSSIVTAIARIALELLCARGNVAASFDTAEIERLVRWAQANPADYGYVAFARRSKTLRGLSRFIPRSARRLFRANGRDPRGILPAMTGRI